MVPHILEYIRGIEMIVFTATNVSPEGDMFLTH